MSFFEDQYDAWMANDCQGDIEDYDGTELAEDEKPRKTISDVPDGKHPAKVRTCAGRDRATLRLDKIEDFAAWAIADGFKREPTKGDFEVLRLRWPGYQPYIFFRRIGAVHATSQAEGTQLVRRWLRERKSTSPAPSSPTPPRSEATDPPPTSSKPS